MLQRPRSAEIDGKVFVNEFPEGEQPKVGQFYCCQITEAHDYDLVAENSLKDPVALAMAKRMLKLRRHLQESG